MTDETRNKLGREEEIKTDLGPHRGGRGGARA
jgi:hypothetical protein